MPSTNTAIQAFIASLAIRPTTDRVARRSLTRTTIDGEFGDLPVSWTFQGKNTEGRAAAFIARLSEATTAIELIHAIAAAEESVCPLPGEGFVLASAILRNV